jgi:CheY-like chemotaxis protein
MANRRVLVVDDDPQIRGSLVRLLELESYHVSEAADGGDALMFLRANPRPCCIILDLMMPGMNGWQFADELSRDASLSGIPMVIISAQQQVRRAAAGILALDYLEKPINVDRLLDAVNQACA